MSINLPTSYHGQPPTELHSIGAQTSIQPRVIDIFSLKEIDTKPSIINRKIRFVLDIDDTLYSHGEKGQFFSLGSRAWRADIKSQLAQKLNIWLQENPSIQARIPADYSVKRNAQILHDYISWFLLLNLPISTIEPNTATFIQELQKAGNDVTLCTAREKKIWYWLEGLHVNDKSGLPVADMTLKQLVSLEIFPSHDPLHPSFTSSFFEGGIHFVPHDTKGEYFTQEMVPTLKAQDFKGEYIFIDDKDSQCASMAKALTEAGIPHRTYYYRAVEELDKKYNSFIASIQLYTLWKSKGKTIISDEQAKDSITLYPERDADWYLKSVVLDILEAYFGP